MKRRCRLYLRRVSLRLPSSVFLELSVAARRLRLTGFVGRKAELWAFGYRHWPRAPSAGHRVPADRGSFLGHAVYGSARGLATVPSDDLAGDVAGLVGRDEDNCV